MEERQLETDQDQETPKAKKGKLPLIIILTLTLAAGGFLNMKMRSGEVAVPELKLGKIAQVEDEFLVPLMGQGNYLRTNISFHLADGADEAALTEQLDAVRDAVNMKLKSKYLKELEALTDIRTLKRELAADVNRLITGQESWQRDSSPRKRSTPSRKEVLIHPDWDSESGPVLKVYFTTFATQ